MNMTADICLINEGTYPYVTGGVASWTHDLIRSHSDKRFHVLSILPPNAEVERKFELPPNVVGVTDVRLQNLPAHGDTQLNLMDMEAFLDRLTVGQSSLEDLRHISQTLNASRNKPGRAHLLDSEAAFALMTAMYERAFPENSFLNYFWSWRMVMASFYSMMYVKLPEASVYHALSTGYAGLLAARAKIEKDRPVILTEHGIYTNERRIELASAEWLDDTHSNAITIDHIRHRLRDLWIGMFTNLSRYSYAAADDIVTLYSGNQVAQQADGAKIEKMAMIPNGIDIDHFRHISRTPQEHPTIALIGRVVPIKDIKSFIRAVAQLREALPDIQAYIIGSAEEDTLYAAECEEMVGHLSLGRHITFTGEADVAEYLAKADLLVLTSISEAQPLVILEAGAAGIPVVSTDVGACRELIYGTDMEAPYLGEGGIVASLANPAAVANAVYALLSNDERRTQCGENLQQRVMQYYSRQAQHEGYAALYNRRLSGNVEEQAA